MSANRGFRFVAGDCIGGVQMEVMRQLAGFFRRFLEGLGVVRSREEIAYQERVDRARALASALPEEVRGRFPKSALVSLLDAGWHGGRCWEQEKLEEFTEKFDMVFPETVRRVLSEFGGLCVGLTGRILVFGYVHEGLFHTRETAGSVVGERLYPVGWSNIFVDDGLAVLMDEAGRVYVDGETGGCPPRDFCVELMGKTMDAFIARAFSGERMKEMRSWFYTYSA